MRSSNTFRRARFEPLEPRTLLTAVATDWIDGSGPSALKNMLPVLESQAAIATDAEMAPGSGAFAVYVENGLRASIQSALDVYVADLAADGYQVNVVDFTGTAEQLRADLTTRWSTANLEGALLVGDLPYVMFTSEDNWSGVVSQATYAHDLYFMDLDGSYVLNASGLDAHTAGTGDVGPEIYVSRITTSNLSGVTGRNEVTLINQYFAKNHAYRHGTLAYQNRGIVFADDDWYYWGASEMDDLYSELLVINDKAATTKAAYMNAISLNYESILECMHSNSTGHSASGTGGAWISNTEIAAANPRQAFYNMFNCSSAAFNVANNLIGTYVYSGDYGLNAVGSAKTGSMLNFSSYYAPQGQGKSLGEAFRIWFDLYAYGTDTNNSYVDWFYGMTMQGDPTLKPARMPYSATVSPATGLATAETGQTATFTVVLDSAPGADVTIPLSSSDPSEGAVGSASLVFSTTNWSTPQTVTVTGIDDLTDDGSMSYSIVLGPAASADLPWNGADPADVTVTNTDNDTAAVAVAPAAGLVTSEIGATATFVIVLTTQPLGGYVDVGLVADDSTEGAISTAAVSFSAGNWNVPQTVTVTGLGDVLADGDQAYHVVTGAAASDAADYSGLAVADVSLVNLDVALARVLIAPATGLTTTEAGQTAVFTVQLDLQPTAAVSFTLTSDDPTEGTLSAASLTFTMSDWGLPQSVTITGIDDEYQDGDASYAIVIGACSSTDPRYSGLAVDDLTAVNLDDDGVEVRLSPSAGLVTDENGGQATFLVWLGSRPASNVRIDWTSSDATEGLPVQASVTFTPSGWNVPQTITIAGVDDCCDDGSVSYQVTGTTASDDPAYQALAVGGVAIVNDDNGDVAHVAAAPMTDLTTAEWGSTTTFTVRLDTQPVAEVTIGLGSSDPGEGTVSPASLTFNPDNWATPQTVTLAGVDDELEDGDQSYTISITSASSDPKYNQLAVEQVSATNIGRAVDFLDPDGNGAADALTDGILILRYLFDPAGQWNYADALGSGATRATRPRIKGVLDTGSDLGLDADGNGTVDALTDGILVLRYLFDPEGQWNWTDALGGGATRTTRDAIGDFLGQQLPTTSPSNVVETPTVELAAVVETTAPQAEVPSADPTAPCEPPVPIVESYLASNDSLADRIDRMPSERRATATAAVDAVLVQRSPTAVYDVRLLRAAARLGTDAPNDDWWSADDREPGDLDWLLAGLADDR